MGSAWQERVSEEAVQVFRDRLLSALLRLKWGGEIPDAHEAIFNAFIDAILAKGPNGEQ